MSIEARQWRCVPLPAAAAAVLALLLACGGAGAQQAGDSSLPEIVVTAQKRSSTADRTPVSITAITGEDLQDRGLATFTALAATMPGMSMKTNGPGQTELEMRGMTSGGGNSPTVGFYLDDVPLTAPAAAQNGKVVIDPGLYDLNRVEVLRGPQGTLYGSGSMGGTVKLVTNPARLGVFEGSAQAVLSATQGGGFNHEENLMLNLPLIDRTLAMRLVASQADTSGWIDRIVAGSFPVDANGGLNRGNVAAAPVLEDHRGSNAETLKGARLSLTWAPTAQLTITPSVFYQRITQAGPSSFDSDPGTPAHYQPFSIAEPYADTITVSNLTIAWRLESVELTSVTSQWHRLSTQVQDGSENFQNPLDGFNLAGATPAGFYGPAGTGPIFGYELDPSNQFSQEIRAASSGDGPLQWVGGVFFSDFASNWQLFTDFPNPAAFGSPTSNVWTLDEPTDIRQSALFGEATYALAGGLKLNGGLRWYTYRNTLDMRFSGFGSPSGTDVPTVTHVVQSSSGINPKLGLSYDLDPDLLLFANAAKGFRPGGGNQPLPAIACIQDQLVQLGYAGGVPPRSYAADSVWSYEAGEKARLFNGAARLNASMYFENWKDIQLEELPCNYPMFDNANSAHITGAEVELRAALGGNLTLAASAGYTHAVLAQNAHGFRAGDRLPDVAPWTASINLSYHRPLGDHLELLARAENTVTGSRVDLTFPAGFPNSQTPLPGYDISNIRIGISADAGWNATLFANNLFNRRAWLENTVQLTIANASFNRVATNQPLTIGMDLSYRF